MARRRRSTTQGRTDPADLPRPALWPKPPPGQQPVVAPSRADDEDGGRAVARSRLPWAWAGVALMIVGLALVAVAVVATSWWLVPAGVMVGLVGVVTAVRSGIMTEVSE